METLTIANFVALLGRDSFQGAVLVLAVLLAQWLLGKRLAPRWRSALWLLVMVRLLLIVSVGSVISVFNLLPRAGVKTSAPEIALTLPAAPVIPPDFTSPGAPALAAPAQPMSREVPPFASQPGPAASASASIVPSFAAPRVSPPFSWKTVLFFAWATGAGALAVYVLVGSIRIHRRIARLAPVTDAPLLALLADCEKRIGVGAKLTVVEGAGIGTPALHGFFHPRLLLPPGFAGQFSPQELRFILLHELAHVKRRDILLNWLAAGLQIAHWFNPFIWLGFARWRADRELACDALALEVAGENQSRAYGETILRLLENFTHRTAMPGLVGILEDKKQLRQRIKLIAGFRAGNRLGLLTACLLAILGIVCLTDAQNSSSSSTRTASSPAITTTNRLDLPLAEPRQVVTNGPAIKVTVLSALTEQPLDHAEVLAPNQTAFFGRHENAPHWLTGKDGIAVIHTGESPSNSVWQTTWFTISVRRQGYAPSGLSWSAGEKDVRPSLPKEITVRLKPGIAVGGAVYDENGSPQAGIKVRVFGYGYNYGLGNDYHQEYPEYWNDSAGTELPATDANGRWQVKDFPVDLPTVAIEFVRPDGSVEKFRNPAEAQNPNEPQGASLDFAAFQAGNARFVLKSGYELHGLTVSPQGRPVPSVRIQTGYGMGNVERSSGVRSDASGHFILRHLSHRQIILTAEAAGYAITSQVVDLPSNLPEIRLQLGKLAPLQVKVEDGNGKALAAAKVATEGYHTEGQLLNFSGTTDDQGVLVWTNAPVSTFALSAASPRSAIFQKIIVAPDQRELTFHLRTGMDQEIVVNAQVIDAKTGAPVQLESANYQTGDREGFKWSAEVTPSGFHLALPASRFRPGMYPCFQLQLKAAGYAQLITPWRDFDEGDWSASFKLQPADLAGRTVSLPDGRPASEARLWTRLDDAGGALFMNQPDRYYGERMVKVQADKEGRFNLPEVPDDQPVVFTHSDGFLATLMSELKKRPGVRLEPWGRVAGSLKIAGQPVGGISVNLATLQWSPNLGFNLTYSASTAPDGSFAFEHVPAGEYKLYRNRTKVGIITEDHQMPLVVKPGETSKVEYANPGRLVIGQAQAGQPDLAVDWLNDDDTLTLKQPALEKTAINWTDFATQKSFQEAYNSSLRSPEQLQQARAARTYVLAFETDGSFRAEDVPPGTYELKIKLTKPDPNNPYAAMNHSGKELGSLTREVVVPPGDGPFDLGLLTVAMNGGASKTAKSSLLNFSAATLDGKAVSLKQYQGRYVVLAFWALWSDRSVDELAALQKLQASFSNDPRVAFLGVSLDSDPAAVAKEVDSRGYKWTQATVNSKDLANVAATFDVSSLPAIFLLDPEGRVMARDLAGDRLTATVQRTLRKK